MGPSFCQCVMMFFQCFMVIFEDKKLGFPSIFRPTRRLWATSMAVCLDSGRWEIPSTFWGDVEGTSPMNMGMKWEFEVDSMGDKTEHVRTHGMCLTMGRASNYGTLAGK